MVMELPRVGHLMEGVLSCCNGTWTLKGENGVEWNLSDILRENEGREVRVTVAAFEDLDILMSMLKSMHDEPSE
jgi:hypothetical protein